MIHWSIAAFGIAFYTAIVAWVLSPKTKHPAIGVFVSITLMAGAYTTAIEILGLPKPLALEWRAMADLKVEGIVPAGNGHTFYVWVVRDGVPVSYSLEAGDGSQQAVADVLDRWRRRQQTGEQFTMTGDNSADGLGMKVKPPEPMPEKDAQ